MLGFYLFSMLASAGVTIHNHTPFVIYKKEAKLTKSHLAQILSDGIWFEKKLWNPELFILRTNGEETAQTKTRIQHFLEEGEENSLVAIPTLALPESVILTMLRRPDILPVLRHSMRLNAPDKPDTPHKPFGDDALLLFRIYENAGTEATISPEASMIADLVLTPQGLEPVLTHAIIEDLISSPLDPDRYTADTPQLDAVTSEFKRRKTPVLRKMYLKGLLALTPEM